MSVAARIKAAVRARLSSAGAAAAPSTTAHESDALTALRAHVRVLGTAIDDLVARAEAVQEEVDRCLASEALAARDRASLAAIPAARLKSASILLDGPASARIRASRRRVGEPVRCAYGASIGVRRAVTDAPDVRRGWEALLAAETANGGLLRGAPATVLDVPGARMSLDPERRLHLSLTGWASSVRTVAIPQFTYTFPPRKLRNVAHWLLDCLPQVAVLLAVAPDAEFLLPEPLLGLHASTLSLLGIDRSRIIEWTGDPLDADRLVVFESDGRSGGGRPLSSLMELRRRLRASAGGQVGRRIYISRRDAKSKRRWAANEAEVESLFRRRGFEIVTVSEQTLPDIVAMFREAGVVAGINGAGLSHMMFSPSSAHLITLFTDSLIRWHSDDAAARALWTSSAGASAERAALGDSPNFFGPVAAVFGQTSHAFLSPDQIPIDLLEQFLDEALAQVTTA